MYFLVKSWTVFFRLLVFVLAGLGIHQGGLPSRLRFEDDKAPRLNLAQKSFGSNQLEKFLLELIMKSNNSLYKIFR